MQQNRNCTVDCRTCLYPQCSYSPPRYILQGSTPQRSGISWYANDEPKPTSRQPLSTYKCSFVRLIFIPIRLLPETTAASDITANFRDRGSPSPPVNDLGLGMDDLFQEVDTRDGESKQRGGGIWESQPRRLERRREEETSGRAR